MIGHNVCGAHGERLGRTLSKRLRTDQTTTPSSQHAIIWLWYALILLWSILTSWKITPQKTAGDSAHYRFRGEVKDAEIRWMLRRKRYRPSILNKRAYTIRRQNQVVSSVFIGTLLGNSALMYQMAEAGGVVSIGVMFVALSCIVYDSVLIMLEWKWMMSWKQRRHAKRPDVQMELDRNVTKYASLNGGSKRSGRHAHNKPTPNPKKTKQTLTALPDDLPSTAPIGLPNNGNWCYLNSAIQCVLSFETFTSMLNDADGNACAGHCIHLASAYH